MSQQTSLRRKYNRYGLRIPMAFSWKQARGIRREEVGVTRDISVAGAYILSTNPPPVETNVKLRAFLPPVKGASQSLRIHGQGLVVRVEPLHDRETREGFAVAGQHFVLRRTEVKR
jgi:hypothetical protein